MKKNLLLTLGFLCFNFFTVFAQKPTMHLVFCSPFEGNYKGMATIQEDFENFLLDKPNKIGKIKRHRLMGETCTAEAIDSLIEQITIDKNAIVFLHFYMHGTNTGGRLPSLFLYESLSSREPDYNYDVDANVVATLEKDVQFSITLIEACNKPGDIPSKVVKNNIPFSLTATSKKNSLFNKNIIKELFSPKLEGHIAISTSKIFQGAKDNKIKGEGAYGSREFYNIFKQSKQKIKFNWLDELSDYSKKVYEIVEEEKKATQTPIYFGEINGEPLSDNDIFYPIIKDFQSTDKKDSLITSIYDILNMPTRVKEFCSMLNNKRFNRTGEFIESKEKFRHHDDLSIFDKNKPYRNFISLKEYETHLKNIPSDAIKWDLNNGPYFWSINKHPSKDTKTMMIFEGLKQFKINSKYDTLTQVLVVEIRDKFDKLLNKKEETIKKKLKKKGIQKYAPITYVVNIPKKPKPPVSKLKAKSDRDTTNFNTPVTTNVLANDDDRDNMKDLTSLRILDDPMHGSYSIDSTGSITYTPYTDYFGKDYYTYQICGGEAGCAEARVTILVIEDLSSMANQFFSQHSSYLINGDNNEQEGLVELYQFISENCHKKEMLDSALVISEKIFSNLSTDSIEVYRPDWEGREKYETFLIQNYIVNEIFKDYKQFKSVKFNFCSGLSLHKTHDDYLIEVEKDKKWVGYLDFVLGFVGKPRKNAEPVKNLTQKTVKIEVTFEGYDNKRQPIFKQHIVDIKAKGISSDTNDCRNYVDDSSNIE